MILGTGFLVHEDGIVATNRHVVELFERLPKHPSTGEPLVGAWIGDYEKPTAGKPGEASFRMMIVELLDYASLRAFNRSPRWHGEENPDIAFVQLEMRQTPYLRLTEEEFYVQPGTAIATAGFPMGTIALTVMGKWNQVIPFVRGGIVSSVFPSSIRWPHGFTIDVMQQGGSSGSPIFYADDPTVVGMMASSVLDPVEASGPQLSFQICLNTNMSIAVPGHIIARALQSFREICDVDRSGLPTMSEWKETHGPPEEGLGWTQYGPT
jgi:Trypsin-like peptidase domain